MSPSDKKQTAFRLDEEILAALHAIKERDGIPISEQVRRALKAWAESKGVKTAKRSVRAPRKAKP
jgi:antitoxin component of RelBE/YafQ-DinJ toxin-antitoxin module